MGELGCGVLIVDDDHAFRETLNEVLARAGFGVACAENGAAALAWLRSGSPHPQVIILDLMMPIMDGRKFREAQLEDPALNGIPVVVLTAGGASAALGMTVNQVLHKPIGASAITRAVERFCAH
jgi:CheY-like chemotaxis protein